MNDTNHAPQPSIFLCALLSLTALVFVACGDDADIETSPNATSQGTSNTSGGTTQHVPTSTSSTTGTSTTTDTSTTTGTSSTTGTNTTTGTGTTTDTSTSTSPLNLPETPYNYADIELPPAYRQGNEPTINLDNTPPSNPTTDHGATLGRVLFYDTNLSQNNTVACASCHQQQHGFSDPEVFSIGFEQGRTGRHSMGLTHARFSHNGRFFWDERAATLEEQVLMPIQDDVEMGLTLEQLEDRVRSQPYYPDLFRNAFGDDRIDRGRIARALAQFVRSMVSTTSPYDLGRAQANTPQENFPNLSAEENEGKRLFFQPIVQGGAGCAACHGSEAFVGIRNENNGLDADTSADEGIGAALNNPRANGAFRAPSLRNIGVRPPYMHDGRFDTLEQVVGFYNSGIQDHPNLSRVLRDQNGRPVRLDLSREQRDALVAFLHTLTDEAMLRDVKYSNPFQAR